MGTGLEKGGKEMTVTKEKKSSFHLKRKKRSLREKREKQNSKKPPWGGGRKLKRLARVKKEKDVTGVCLNTPELGEKKG